MTDIKQLEESLTESKKEIEMLQEKISLMSVQHFEQVDKMKLEMQLKIGSQLLLNNVLISVL